jgi:hypothetical protein
MSLSEIIRAVGSRKICGKHRTGGKYIKYFLRKTSREHPLGRPDRRYEECDKLS